MLIWYSKTGTKEKINTLEQILFYLVLFSFKFLWKFWEAVSDHLSTLIYQKPQSWELIFRIFHSKSFIDKGEIYESEDKSWINWYLQIFLRYHTFILWTQDLQRNVKFPVCILVFRPFVITWRITLRLLSKIGNINIRTNCKFKL